MDAQHMMFKGYRKCGRHIKPQMDLIKADERGFVSEESVVFIGGEANSFDKVLMLEL